MARRDMDRTHPGSPRDNDWTDQDDRVRGRADEMEDASRDEEFDDTEDLNDEDEEEGEGSI